MSREIRFRAWDKEKKKMALIIGDEFLKAYVCPERFEIMQYTGLKDIKGKEIYEGDIVQFKNDEIGQIYWDELCVGFEVESNTNGRILTIPLCWIKDDGISIIGNIYENKELIKNDIA